MPTQNVVNTTLMKLYTGSTLVAVAHCNGASLSMTHDPRDITTKDSSGWQELLEGLRSFELSGEGLVAFDDVNGGLALTSSLLNRTQLVIALQTNVTGDTKWSGSGYVSSLEVGSPGQEENVTYNFTIRGTGALVQGTV